MAHIIVFGNEKGGSGKSTTCMHVATALVRSGQRVGTLDLDLRQRTFTRYLENRADYARVHGTSLPTPVVMGLPKVDRADLAEGENPSTHRWPGRLPTWRRRAISSSSTAQAAIPA